MRERRVQLGFREDPTDEPGIVLGDDGVFYQVASDGTRSPLGNGGSSSAIGASRYLSADTPYSAWGDNLTFDTSDYDTDGFWSIAHDTFRLPAGLDGIYLVTGIVYLSAEAGLTAVDGIADSDNNNRNDFQIRLSQRANELFGSFSCSIALSAGNDVWIQLSLPSGYAGNLPSVIGGTGNSYFSILKLTDLPT